MDFLRLVGSWLIAIARLVVLCIILFFEGLHQIFFAGQEVSGIIMRNLPLRIDRDKMSYVDNLVMNNMDLMEYQGEDEQVIDEGEDDGGIDGQ